jgi:RHS repeat-associated protein
VFLAGRLAQPRTLARYRVNRYYDPSTAVFLTVDPLVGSTDQPYDYAGQDPINGYDLSGTVKTDEGGLPLGISTECGKYGGQSCAGTEGNASDWTSWSPANKHPELVVVPAFVIGCVFLCSEGAAAEAFNSLTARFGARRALIAVALAIGADEGDQAAGPASVDRQRVASQVYFAIKRLNGLVRIPQPSLITINRWLRSIWPRR